ncbi:DUF1269 domain-containing protein [Paracoccus sulfuroxidans]|uniref:Putative membrane protein n=1 Tax=Paracoccus sulfuroxidans TaxID=384678 RepID=A0A562NQN0_9RHOB|nr:DUF1269 domain-containing protein [Paracoccus sulfuroxidans]TWI34341.1 putative membrane protein [Paracoccus sulfuroxidans]
MSDLVVVAFDDEKTGFDLRDELVKLQQEYLLELEDIVVVTRDQDGKIKLHQALNTTAAGAVGGGFWGTLVGLLFLNPLLGAAVGAASGALAGKLTDIGINDDFIRQVSAAVPNGGSADFVLIRKATADKVLDRLKAFHKRGHIIQTNLSADADAKLREAFESGDAPEVEQAPLPATDSAETTPKA